MKTLGFITCLILFSVSVSAQHPLSKKGPNAKNYKVLKERNSKGGEFSVYTKPSEKYASGANAKNTRVHASKTTIYPSFDHKRGIGANAKNRYISTRKAVIKNPETKIDTPEKQHDLKEENSVI